MEQITRIMKGVNAVQSFILLSLMAVVLFFSSATVHATSFEPLVISSTAVDEGAGVMQRYLIKSFVGQHIGQQQLADTEQAARLSNAEFEMVGKGAPYLAAKTHWFRFYLRNDSNAARSFVLNLDQSLIDKIQLQASIQDVVVKRVVTGQGYPRSSRDIDYDFFAFRLDVPAGATIKVDFSVTTSFAAIFIPSLVSADKFAQQITFDGRFVGGVMGMLYALIFFLIIYTVAARKFGLEALMLFFAVSSLGSAMYMAGIFQRFIPDAYGEWRNIIYLFIHAPQGIAFAWLFCGYYQVATKYIALYRVCIFLCVINAFTFVAAPWLPLKALMQTTLAANTSLMLVGVIVSVWVLVARKEDKKLFSIGLILFVIMAMFSSLASMGVPIPYIFARYSYELGLTLELDFMAAAVVLRVMAVERERLAAEGLMSKLHAEMEARSEFVDRVTHDVKSPLSAVVGAVHLLRESVTPEQKTKYLDVIQQSSNAVITIVDSILSYSRLKSGHVALHKQSFSIAALLSELENAMHVSYRQKNIAFSVVSDGMLPLLVVGDRNRLQQLLNNLLTNAFKFTDEGSVKLLVSVVARSVERVTLRFEVHDTGIGMSPEFVTRAFEPYAREESTAGYRQGFGLGLPICKQLVEMMHGTIHISSSLGVGSVFIVELPFDLPA